MGRPTDDKKPSNLIVRVNDETKERLQREAKSRGITVSEYTRGIICRNVMQNNNVLQNNNVMQNELQERISELEADIKKKQERIAELEFLNDADYVEQLKARIKELEEYTPQDVFSNLSFDVEAELRDTLRMVELSSSKDDVPVFLKDLHDRLESGELQIENGRLKLGYSEIFEVLNRAETKKWLKGVWEACETRGRTYQEGLRAVFCEGSKRAVEAIYGDKR